MPVTPIDKNQAPRGYSADDAAQVSRVASMRPAAVVAFGGGGRNVGCGEDSKV